MTKVSVFLVQSLLYQSLLIQRKVVEWGKTEAYDSKLRTNHTNKPLSFKFVETADADDKLTMATITLKMKTL